MARNELDDIDKQILDILDKDGRASYKDIAKIVRRSPSAVRKRVAHMMRDELIERFTVVLNPAKVGKNITASLTITPSRLRFQKISDHVSNMPEVIEAYYMTGKCGILAIVQVPSIEDLDKCIQEIQRGGGVLAVDACVTLKRIK